MNHPRIGVPGGTIRRLMDRTRHLREPRVSQNPVPQALPGDEIPEWTVERGRGELVNLIARAHSNQQQP